MCPHHQRRTPPQTNKLTDTPIRKARHGDKSVKMADGGGLYHELRPNGSRYWRMKYRFGGVEKRLAFGVHPEVTLVQYPEGQARVGGITDRRIGASL